MIAIKDMEEMPKACTSTQEILGDIVVADCPLYNVCKHRDTIRTNYKPSDCPLVEIIVCKDCSHYTEYKALDGITYVGCDKGHSNLSPNFYCDDAERRAQ